MSRVPEVASWLTKAGYTVLESTDNTLRAYVLHQSAADAEKLERLGASFGANEIILLVSMNQINVADPSNRPAAGRGDHFVRLASPVGTRDDYLYFRIWTWGAEKEMKVRRDDLGRVVFGYVVARPPRVAVQPPPAAVESLPEAAVAAEQAEPGAPVAAAPAAAGART